MRKLGVVLVIAMAPLALGNIIDLALDGTDPEVLSMSGTWQPAEFVGGALRMSGLGNGNGMDPDDPDFPETPVGWFGAGVDLASGIDITAAGAMCSFEGRYFQEEFDYYPDDGVEGTVTGPMVTRTPYQDAALTVRLVSEDPEGRKYVKVMDGEWALTAAETQSYPEWSTGSFSVADADLIDSWWIDPDAVWTPTNIVRFWFIGTDWSGRGNDFAEVRNLVVTPEPGALALLALGGLALLRRR